MKDTNGPAVPLKKKPKPMTFSLLLLALSLGFGLKVYTQKCQYSTEPRLTRSHKARWLTKSWFFGLFCFSVLEPLLAPPTRASPSSLPPTCVKIIKGLHLQTDGQTVFGLVLFFFLFFFWSCLSLGQSSFLLSKTN
jgi:hypothetical protein